MADNHPNPAPWEGPSQSPVGEEGGEWQLLTSRLTAWASSDGPQQLGQKLRTPLKTLAWLLAGLFVLRIYGAVLAALASFPLLPGLLELTGLIWLCRYGAPKLLRRKDRDGLISDLKRSWQGLDPGEERPLIS